ncbi:MAG: amidase [Pseudomonadota bacterium]
MMPDTGIARFLPGGADGPDACTLSSALAGKELRAERLMEITLDRIASVNSRVNAIVSLRPAEELLAEAASSDDQDPVGPLHGLPVAIKDLADARGLPTSQGSPVFAEEIAEADSPHVARLRAAGAIVIGKTNTPEFGLGSNTYNPVHGATANPYDTSRTCGGSSGGAAVALACGMVAIADGSDMMGSLRNPAGWNNVYGMRPTWGRVPGNATGDLFLHRLSTNGPMARSPADLALQLNVMSGVHPLASVASSEPVPIPPPESKAGGTRIGWLGDWGGAWPFERGILALCENALGVFADLGAAVDPVPPPFARDDLWQSWIQLRSWSIASELHPLLTDPSLSNQLKPEAIWEIEQARALSALDIHRASEIRSDWWRRALTLFETYDALALPTAQCWPFSIDLHWPKTLLGKEMDTYHRWMEVTTPASLLGLPVVAIPAGFGEAGLPMGVQLIGPPDSDGALLTLAQAYHEATRWPQRAPPGLTP